jgi:hypothetical protein
VIEPLHDLALQVLREPDIHDHRSQL